MEKPSILEKILLTKQKYLEIQKKNTPQNDKLSARIVKIQFIVFDLIVLLINADFVFEI